MKVYHIFHNKSDETVEKSHHEHHEGHHHEDKTKDIKESIIRSLEKEFKEYIAKHGYHFSNALAEFASRQMRNAEEVENGSNNHQILTAEYVKTKLTFLGLTVSPETTGTNTLGDITYEANMVYSDVYPELLDKEDCIRYGYLIAKDPDGYEGMIFKRWCTDMMEKHLKIDWLEYI